MVRFLMLLLRETIFVSFVEYTVFAIVVPSPTMCVDTCRATGSTALSTCCLIFSLELDDLA